MQRLQIWSNAESATSAILWKLGMPALSLYVRTLQRAAGAAGSPEALAQALGVSLVLARAWLAGNKEPPAHIFLAAVDIIITRDLDFQGLSSAAQPKDGEAP
jgi:hypothetical protein